MPRPKSFAVRSWSLAALGLVILLTTASFVKDYFEIAKNLDIMASVYREVNTYYVDETDPGKLMKTGIDAMLESLDPYTNYISESEAEDYKFQTTGAYGGVGASIGLRDGRMLLTEVYEGRPAMKAGLQAGDELIMIDGKTIKGLTTADVSKLLKGAPGTIIEIKVNRPGTGELVKKFEREEIHIKNVPYFDMVDNETGYIRLRGFTSDAGKEVADALNKLKENSGLKSLILDLRGNPGGLLMEAVNIVNVFAPRGTTVVHTRGKLKEWEKEYSCSNQPVDLDIPMVVLVNHGSASASEIVSGTIQDLDRGLVIGHRTYGKGLVQTTRSLSYGTQLKVTTAKYYTPSGRCIQALDYAHRRADGSVGEIPDSLKKEFKTKNGRKVMDGGGVEPDIKTVEKEYSEIAQTLVDKNLIFDFATQYHLTHPTIAPAKDFKIDDKTWNDFIAFLQGKDYTYETQSEKALLKFKEQAEKDKYFEQVKMEYDALKKSLQRDKTADIEKNKVEIAHLLELEICRRYYFEKANFESTFSYDIEIQEALKILKDPSGYNALLGRKP